MTDQPSELHGALSEAIRTAVMVGMQAAELVAQRRAEQARAAQARSDQAARELRDRYRSEHEAAKLPMRRVWDARWWREADPAAIGATWQVAAGWAASGDPFASFTLTEMRDQLSRRYGVVLPDLPLTGGDVAALLAREPAADEPATQAGEPEFVEREQTSYGYVIRQASDPNTVLARGSLSADAGAAVEDVAISGLRDYRRGGSVTAQSPNERMDRLYGAALGATETRDLAGIAIDVYADARGEGEVIYTLAGDELDATRSALRTTRQNVIDGNTQAETSEILAAILLEQRAAAEDLRDRDDPRSRALGDADAEAAVADTRARIEHLELRRRMVEAEMRGEDGAVVAQAELLRRELDEGWWTSASPEEVAGVWEHVAGWSPGLARDDIHRHLQYQTDRHFGTALDRSATGADVRRSLGIEPATVDTTYDFVVTDEIADYYNDGDRYSYRTPLERGTLSVPAGATLEDVAARHLAEQAAKTDRDTEHIEIGVYPAGTGAQARNISATYGAYGNSRTDWQEPPPVYRVSVARATAALARRDIRPADAERAEQQAEWLRTEAGEEFGAELASRGAAAGLAHDGGDRQEVAAENEHATVMGSTARQDAAAAAALEAVAQDADADDDAKAGAASVTDAAKDFQGTPSQRLEARKAAAPRPRRGAGQQVRSPQRSERGR